MFSARGPLSQRSVTLRARCMAKLPVRNSSLMKKTAQSLTLSLGVLAVFFIALPARAQTGHFVLISQGQLDQNTVFDSVLHNYSVEIGTGYQGTTTGAFVSLSANASGVNDAVRLTLIGYLDSSYSGSTVSCGWQNHNATSYVGTSTSPFAQLTNNFVNSNGTACTLDPSLYYVVALSYDFSGGAGSLPSGSVFGSLVSVRPGWNWTAGTFFPYFSIVTDGFQITPTASSSGVFLSGAQQFCDSKFASSSPLDVASGIAHGGCVVAGYLFVPTPESVSQFGNLAPALQSKIPFSYFYDIIDIVNGSTASSTQNMTAFGMDLGVLDFASSTGLGPILPVGNFDFLSSTTISKYMPVGMHDLLYNMMIAAIWVDVAWLFYRKIVPNKANI